MTHQDGVLLGRRLPARLGRCQSVNRGIHVPGDQPELLSLIVFLSTDRSSVLCVTQVGMRHVHVGTQVSLCLHVQDTVDAYQPVEKGFLTAFI